MCNDFVQHVVFAADEQIYENRMKNWPDIQTKDVIEENMTSINIII